MAPHIVSTYAAILGLVFVALSVRTLTLRRTLGVIVGDGGIPQMLRAMRVHANFAEYVPISLLLLYLLEQQGAGTVFLNVSCLALLAGRLVHAWGVSHVREDVRFRVVGMTLTIAVIVAASVRLLAGELRF
jgi:hypothetical protein